MSIRYKFLLPTLLVLLVGTSALTIVSYLQSKKTVEDAVARQLHELSHSAVQSITAWLDANKRNVKAWSEDSTYKAALEDSFIGKASRKKSSVMLSILTERFPSFTAIYLVDTEGRSLAASNQDEPFDLMLVRQPFFQQALNGVTSLSKDFNNGKENILKLVVAAPVSEGEGNGVLVGFLNFSKFASSAIDFIKIGETGAAFLVNQEGLVIAHPEKDKIFKINIKDQGFGKEILSKKEGMAYHEEKGVEKIAFFHKEESTGWRLILSGPISELFGKIIHARNINIALTITILILVSFIIFLITDILTKPIKKAVGISQKLSHGDLSEDIVVVSEDETGQLLQSMKDVVESLREKVKFAETIAARDLTSQVQIRSEKDLLSIALQQMVENLSSTIHRISSLASSLATGSAILSGTAGQLTTSSDLMKGNSSDVAASMEEMSTNINTMATAIEEMSLSVHTISSTAEQMSQDMNSVAGSVEQMDKSIGNIATNSLEGTEIAKQAITLSEKASNTMHDLGNSAGEISEVTTVIKRIADKTNLLALNATIEAASAGEAGKGFAVVANEIKELARQSSEAAEKIAKQINSTRKNTDDAVNVITEVSTIINTMHEASRTISESVKYQKRASNEISETVRQANLGASGIASSIGEVAHGANELARNAGEAALGINEITMNINEINEAATQALDDSQHVKHSSEETAGIALDLNNLVDEFVVKAPSISSSVEEDHG